MPHPKSQGWKAGAVGPEQDSLPPESAPTTTTVLTLSKRIPLIYYCGSVLVLLMGGREGGWYRAWAGSHAHERGQEVRLRIQLPKPSSVPRLAATGL